MSFFEQTDNHQEAKPRCIGVTPWRVAVWHLILYVTVTHGRKHRGGMKSVGDRLGRWEKAKPGGGKFWDWVKGEMIDTYLLYIGG